MDRLDLPAAARLPAEQVLDRLDSASGGLAQAAIADRQRSFGRNVLPTHHVSGFEVLLRQLKSWLLLLLVFAAAVSAVVGDANEALIIGVIIAMSVGLSFLNEFRSEQAVEALHAQISHRAYVTRDGTGRQVPVADLVPGDVVHLRVGDVVPADLRLLRAQSLSCDESVLTGESRTAHKQSLPITASDSAVALASCAFMGTVVSSGAGVGIVVATGATTTFGSIAARLAERHEQTAFQRGLSEFSRMLATVTTVLAGSIFAINVALGRSVLESALFALAIAVGLTPQLLPAIVTVSLATGSRRLARHNVIVKRLVCIEDLGNVQVLFTDKTGTLTEGRIRFQSAIDPQGAESTAVFELALLASDLGGNDLDQALWAARVVDDHPATEPLDRLPFDHERQLASVLVAHDDRNLVVTKGAPERVLAACADVPAEAQPVLRRLFDDGLRVLAVATRTTTHTSLAGHDESGLQLAGFLCFSDPVKADSAASVARLQNLGITVKVITGDNGLVAQHVCDQLGLQADGVLTGADLDQLSDHALLDALPRTTIFARVTPEQKARVILLQRSLGLDVGFLGDGVNDALALHKADVGISVDSAVEVAKDAADVVLLNKDLGILADGVAEGRRVFANTIKYVLMGTSSNFGNMFSAAGASLFLSFLPMLPTQILLNNLLYDLSEMTIPTDNVDEELLARPSQWDISMIRRFMAFFGPISSIYDFLTFGVMLWGFNAGPTEFRSGWFVESLATQTLVIFIIRTRRVPFYRSRPSSPLLFATLACASLAVAIPYIPPVARAMGFTPLPVAFLGVLVVLILTYLALAEVGKAVFFSTHPLRRPHIHRGRSAEHRIRRRAARFTARH